MLRLVRSDCRLIRNSNLAQDYPARFPGQTVCPVKISEFPREGENSWRK